jgi:hypothetical protein
VKSYIIRYSFSNGLEASGPAYLKNIERWRLAGIRIKHGTAQTSDRQTEEEPEIVGEAAGQELLTGAGMYLFQAGFAGP